MGKRLVWLPGVLAGVLGVMAAVLWRWMQTPDGRLHPYMAVIHKISQRRGEPLTLENLEARRAQMAPPAASAPLARVEDRAIAGPHGAVPLRIYTPFGERPFPLLVFFHGGGFALGGIRTHDHMARRFALELGAVVLSVEYRLAPEHPFPQGFDDCFTAVQWAAENGAALGGDPARLLVAGDSAGGNLAAAAALRARDEGGPPIAMQFLIYPSTRMFGDTSPSRRQFAGYLLREDVMQTFHEWYIADTGLGDHPYASPLLALDLGRLPPAYVVTAGMDPLRDQGRAYAQRLREAGVPVVYRNCEGMLHAFMAFEFLERAPLLGRFFTAPRQVYADMRALLAEL